MGGEGGMAARIPFGVGAQLGLIGLLLVGAAASTFAPRTAPPAPAPSGHAGGPALILVHDEWVRSGAGPEDPCPDGRRRMDAELQAVAAVLARHGLAVRVVPDAELDTLSFAEAPLVVHHNGGWGSVLPIRERQALDRAWQAGVPQLFLGDDAAAMVAGAPVERARMGIRRVLDNGRMPARLRVHADVGAPAHLYVKEPDRLQLEPQAATLVSTDEGDPVVWWIDRGGPRVGVAGLSLRASEVCPMMDAEGEARIEGVLAELVGTLLRR